MSESPKGLGGVRPHLHGLLAGEIRLVAGDRGAEGIGRRGPGARRVLPLRLGQEAVGPPGLPRQPFRIVVRLFPRHVHDRSATPPPVLVIGLVAVAAALGEAGVPLAERDLEPADRERRREPDLMGRVLVRLVARLGLRRAHREAAGGHDHHLGAGFAVPERRSGSTGATSTGGATTATGGAACPLPRTDRNVEHVSILRRQPTHLVRAGLVDVLDRRRG